MLRWQTMRRVRLLVTCAAVSASFVLGMFGGLAGCGSFDSAPPPAESDGGPPEAAASESGSPDGAASDATTPHRTLTPIYARGYGSVGDASGPVTVVPTGLDVDPSGGVIVAGSFAGGPVDIGNHALPAPRGGDAFIVQLDGSGGHVMSQVFGDDMLQQGGEVAGSASRLYATFVYSGTLAFDGGMPIPSKGMGNNPNSLATRFGPQLGFAEAFNFSSSESLRITHLALGTSDTAIVFGDWTRALQIGSASSITRNPIHSGLVVAKVFASNSALDVVRTDYCSDNTSCFAGALATDLAGDMVVGGRFTGTIAGVGGGPDVSTSDEDAYVMKLDSQLVPQWLFAFGGAGAQDVTAIAPVPKTSDFIVAGVFHGAFTAPGQMSVAAVDAGSDVFVARIDSKGAVLWVKTFGGGGDDVVRGVSVDGDANVFFVGDFHGPNLTFGGDLLFNADNQGRGTRDVFLAWLDGGGNHVYSASFGSPGDETPAAIGIDGTGNIVIAGSFDQGIDFGSGLVRAVGATDMFVTRLAR
jgi:hypothetical protein